MDVILINSCCLYKSYIITRTNSFYLKTQKFSVSPSSQQTHKHTFFAIWKSSGLFTHIIRWDRCNLLTRKSVSTTKILSRQKIPMSYSNVKLTLKRQTYLLNQLLVNFTKGAVTHSLNRFSISKNNFSNKFVVATGFEPTTT